MLMYLFFYILMYLSFFIPCISHVLVAAKLPQKVSLPCVKAMRANVINNAHLTYEWNPKPISESELGWGINRYLNVTSAKPLPKIFKITSDQAESLIGVGLHAAINAGLDKFEGKILLLKEQFTARKTEI